MNVIKSGLSLLTAGVLGLAMLPLGVQAAGSLGDVNGDSSVNAKDAAEILVDAARSGSGAQSRLTAAQRTIADANGDGSINANDAAEVLVYAAKFGSGGIRVSFSEFMSSRRQTQPVQTSMESEIVALVNEQRAAYGLSPLQSNALLNAAAVQRASEITQSFSHTRPNGSVCFSVLDEMSIRYYACGENIAYGRRSASDVMNAWMNSSGHRSNILDADFGYIGVGIANSGGTLYFVQVFTGGTTP